MKQKNGRVPIIHLENFLEKMKLVKRKKTRNVNKQAIYTIIYPKKKKTKDVNMHMKITETFPKKTKTKSINMFVNDKEIFLKSLNFLWKYFYIF